MQSKISQSDKYCVVSHVEFKKYNKLVAVTKKKQSHRCRKSTYGYPGGRGRGKLGVWG